MELKKKKSIPKPTYFGANLKFLRRMSGVSQKDLALKLNLSRNKIASYESGIVEPNAIIFLGVCSFFNIVPKDMLASLLAESPLESTQIDPKELNTIEKHIVDRMDEFIAKTNEMTKILDGYKVLSDWKSANTEDETTIGLYRAFNELLELLEMLVQTNWDLIHQVIPFTEQEDES